MLKNLQLERSLAFIDLETTGLNPTDGRIVELSILKLHPDGTEQYKNRRLNPSIPIPSRATAVHGITDADVLYEPRFTDIAKSLHAFLEDCDISGFNIIGFDLKFLAQEFKRAGIAFSLDDRNIIDTEIIFHKYEPRTLQAAYKKYCDKELINAHSAEADTKAAMEILSGQLEMYSDLPHDVTQLSEFCKNKPDNAIDDEGKFVWEDNEATFTFGKHKGRLLRDIATNYPDYLQWLLDKTELSPQLKTIVTNALNGQFPIHSEVV